jgi:hypothetical protein
MVKKKILIVSRAFYPIIAPRSFRATELAKEFSLQGHEVVVLTHKRNYDYSTFEAENGLLVRDFVHGSWFEICGSTFIHKVLRFISNYLFLFPDIQLTWKLRKALSKLNGFDLLISIAVPYPVHWGVALARKKNNNLCKIWVADCGDPFIGNKEDGMRKPFYFKHIEDWFCRNADFITIPVKEALTAYPIKYQKKIRVIPQGFKFELKAIDTVNNNKGEKIFFAYAGSLSKGFRDPTLFLEYLCIKENIDFEFVVYTKDVGLIEPFLPRLLNKIKLRDYIPRDELLVELKKMDFLLNVENINDVQVPSKLIDFAITGRPILSFKPFDLDKIKIDEFLIGNYDKQLIIENVEDYKIENVVTKFLDLNE